MKKPTLIVLILILANSFLSSQNLRINRLTYKWNAHESDVKNCEECKINTRECCVVEYLHKRYLKYTSYKLDKKGKVDTVYSFHVPLGVNIFSVDEYVNLFKSDSSVKNQKIYWDNKNKVINDNGSLIKRFKIDSIQKKIYFFNSDRLTIYEYE